MLEGAGAASFYNKSFSQKLIPSLSRKLTGKKQSPIHGALHPGSKYFSPDSTSPVTLSKHLAMCTYKNKNKNKKQKLQTSI